jgi:hypothetical protein
VPTIAVMRTLVATAIALAVPSVALAQPSEPAPAPPAPVAPPVPAPAPPPAPPMMAPAAPPLDAWQLQARLPTNFGVDSLINSGFVIGHRSGNMVIGAEIGLTGGRVTSDNSGGGSTSDSVLLFQIMPMIYVDLWHSRDERARLNLVGGLGIGRGSLTEDRTDSMNLTSASTSSILFMPILAGIGGDYYISPNFAVGVELSAEVPIVLSVTSDSTDQKIGGAIESLHGMLRFTFVIGD